MNNTKILALLGIMTCGITLTSKGMEQENTPVSKDDGGDQSRQKRKQETLQERLMQVPECVFSAMIAHLNDSSKNNILILKRECLEPDYTVENNEGEVLEKKCDGVSIDNAVAFDFRNASVCYALYHVAIQRNIPALVKSLISGYPHKTNWPLVSGDEYFTVLSSAFMLGREEVWGDLISFFASNQTKSAETALKAFVNLLAQGDVTVARKLLEHEGAKKLLAQNYWSWVHHQCCTLGVDPDSNTEVGQLLAQCKEEIIKAEAIDWGGCTLSIPWPW